MKTYSIGREQGCDIVINDNTDVISRRHADLKVGTFGKMTIVDHSTNGTYVNGIRITRGVPVPVTRNDSISFAHIAKLDWNLIPRTHMLEYAIGMVVLALLLIGVFGFKDSISTIFHDSDAGTGVQRDYDNPNTPPELNLDSLNKAREDSLNKVREDSLKKVLIDSLNKAREDSLNKLRIDAERKAKKANEKKEEEVKSDSIPQRQKQPDRPII